MKTAVDIYKLLPRTNCGTCGMPNCFGFATKVAAGMASITDCTTLSDAVKREVSAEQQRREGSRGTVYEQALAALRPKIAVLDFAATAARAGARLLSQDSMEITLLNEPFTVTRERILDRSGKEPLPFLAILIYNHLAMPDPPPPAGEWITFSSVPASHAKDKAWAAHVEEVIAKHYSGNTAGLRAACERMGGKPADVKGTHDAAFDFFFFPRYPVRLLFFDAVPDEDFPAQVRLLLDRNVDRYLDIESIVVLGEEFAGRMTGP